MSWHERRYTIGLSQVKILSGSVLKPLVAVELQRCSDSLFLLHHSQVDGIQNEIHRLLCTGLIGNNAVIIQITNRGWVQHSLFGVDVGDIGHPFAVGPVCLKWTIQKIFIFVQLLPHLNPFSPAANFCPKAVFLHDSQNCLGLRCVPCFSNHSHIRRYPYILKQRPRWTWIASAKPAPSPCIPNGGQSHHIHSGIPQKTGTWQRPDNALGSYRSHDILLLALLPFCELQKIPQPLVSM